eukprot:sb/3463725/
MKYGIGGAIVLLLILIIWFPLLFMSVVTTNSIPNPPTGFACSLSISGLEPLVSVRVAQMPEPMTDDELSELQRIVGQKNNNYTGRSANYTEFVKRFRSPDVVKLDIYTDSTTLWEVSPAAVTSLKKLLSDPKEIIPYLTMRFDWSITRDPESSTADKVVTGTTEIDIRDRMEGEKGQRFVDRQKFYKLIKDCDVTHPLTVSQLIPTFLLAGETGNSEELFLFPDNTTNTYNKKTVELSLVKSLAADPDKCYLWSGYYWSFNQKSGFLEPFRNSTRDPKEIIPYLTMRFDWSITRDPESSTADKVVTGTTEIDIRDRMEGEKGQRFVDRQKFYKLIKDCDVTHPLTVSQLIPTFLLAGETGNSEELFLFPDNTTNTYNKKTVELSLVKSLAADPDKCYLWSGYYWSFNQKSGFLEPFRNSTQLSTNKAQFYVFSERIVSSQYQLIASYGVIGLYISVVLVLFKFIRLVITDSSTRIIFQEMPCPDLIMSLVSSTEMVRSQREFVLEQVLYRKLLLLYRSPETLIVWTGRHRRLKEE